MDISESIEQAISNYVSQWLGQHPYLAWALSHPIPSLLLLLLAIFSLWGLIKAIGRGIEQIWLFLLKTPFRLLQPIFGLIWRSIERIFGYTNPSAVPLTGKTPPERIERIVDRLHTLAREQETLLDELSSLTATSSVQTEQRSISDTKYGKL
jgi:hypothetical protein